MKTVAYLRPASPLLKIFPSGEVPIVSLIVLRGRGDRPDCYILDPTKITESQRDALIERLVAKGCSELQAITAINEGLPLALDNFCGAETADPKQVELMLECGRE